MLMIIIDGTGPYSPEQYTRSFRNSFCHQTKVQLKQDASYYPGPGSAGVTTGLKACAAFIEIRKFYQTSPADDIFLMGYSRGGAGVIQTAKWCNLANNPIPIKAMFLLDPVCKDISLDADGIPSNVATCYALYRDTQILHYNAPLKTSDYEDFFDKAAVDVSNQFLDGDPDRYAREWMGNCQVCREPGNRVTHIACGHRDGIIPKASHGAVGGVPWLERTADNSATQEAANRINRWMGDEKLVPRVKDLTFIYSHVRSESDEELEADMKSRQAKAAEEFRQRVYHNAARR